MVATNLRFEVRNELAEWFLDRRKLPKSSIMAPEKSVDGKRTTRSTWMYYIVALEYQKSLKKLIKYRVYVNNNLIVERDWIWDNSIYLKEDIWVKTNLLEDCKVNLELVDSPPGAAKFTINNFQLINAEGTISQVDDLQVNFRVDKYIDTQLESQQ